MSENVKCFHLTGRHRNLCSEVVIRSRRARRPFNLAHKSESIKCFLPLSEIPEIRDLRIIDASNFSDLENKHFLLRVFFCKNYESGYLE